MLRTDSLKLNYLVFVHRGEEGSQLCISRDQFNKARSGGAPGGSCGCRPLPEKGWGAASVNAAINSQQGINIYATFLTFTALSAINTPLIYSDF